MDSLTSDLPLLAIERAEKSKAVNKQRPTKLMRETKLQQGLLQPETNTVVVVA